MLLRDMHPVERPRERLARTGPEALGDAELLALVLRTGYTGRSALEVAGAVLAALPQGLHKASYSELARLKGVGPSRAAALTAAFELARRAEAAGDGRAVLDSPARVLEHVPPEVRAGRKEHFLAFYVNARSQLVYRETVSIGTLSASLVHPREVFAPAVAHAAAAVIVVHNHPSGDCTPSAEDKDATRRLSRAGELLGIPLLDHMIVSPSKFFSFKDHGLMS